MHSADDHNATRARAGCAAQMEHTESQRLQSAATIVVDQLHRAAVINLAVLDLAQPMVITRTTSASAIESRHPPWVAEMECSAPHSQMFEAIKAEALARQFQCEYAADSGVIILRR